MRLMLIKYITIHLTKLECSASMSFHIKAQLTTVTTLLRMQNSFIKVL